ncbi:MMPL family transporter [Agromyces sp. NPDC057865]|uniref:MMPL family transporter n=1 Tax=Agromyces sp. NPDC057865 TaxID=3346267 RepID=UPI00366B3511
MSSVLSMLGRWAYRARVLVVACWAVAIAVLFTVAALVGTGTDNTYRIPGTESQEALDALARTFPQVAGSSAQLIAVAPDGGDVTQSDFEADVAASIDAISGIPQVSSVSNPYDTPGSANIAEDDSAVLVPIQLSVGTTAVEPSTAQSLQAAGAALEASLPDGSQVSVGGQLFSQTSTGISATELVGLAVAFVVLLVTFASLAAAGMPLLTALLGASAALAIVYVGTRFLTITSTTPLLALMLGLAVGIDYALFIISRHQDQLKQGIEPEESTSRAVATAGSAVVFAATTVIIALLGLAVAGIPFLTTMGVAAALAVAIAVLISTTLTPALLGFAKWHVVARRFRPGGAAAAAAAVTDAAKPAAPDEESEPVASSEPPDAPAAEPLPDDEPEAPVRRGFFAGWVRGVIRWPIVTVALVVIGLSLLAVPAASLRLALPDAGSLDEAEPARITYDLIDEHFGPGYNGPLLVTGQVIQSTDPVGLMDDIGAEIATVKGVASVPLATPNEAGDTGIVQVIPEGGPDSEETKALVAELRGMHDHFQEEYGVDLAVTGYTAAGIDISIQLTEALLPFGVLIVGLSLVLLAMVFRSIVVPVTAALGYVLSIAAALGLTALVFVHGFLAGPIGVASVGTVISFMPIILMGVLFGLAMDYEVFLVTRMREDYVHHGRPRRAIIEGFVGSGRVVTAAAIIMVAVFAAFVPEGDASIQPIAFGLAVGVAIDAFVVRMTLIPAVLALFGHRAWWIPAWLDRLLPRFDVEGEGLSHELELADWPEPGSDLALVAEGLRTSDAVGAPEVDLAVAPGELLLVRGGTASARSAVLLALGGRSPVLGGRVKVDGLVLPTRAGAVRRRTAYVHAGRTEDVVGDLRNALVGASVVMVDAIDAVTDPVLRARVRHLMTDAAIADRRRDGAPLTFVVACRPDARLDDLLPSRAIVRTVTLASSTAGPTLATVR